MLGGISKRLLLFGFGVSGGSSVASVALKNNQAQNAITVEENIDIAQDRVAWINSEAESFYPLEETKTCVNLNSPPQHSEVTFAVRNLLSNPDIFTSILPNGLPEIPRDRESDIVDALMLMLTNENIIENIAKEAEKKKCPSQIHTTSETVMASNNWKRFPENHTCVICCDLLAAPTVLGCGHSFCGECISDYMDSCRSEGEMDDVVHNCPVCRVEILGVTREIILDEDIVKFVDGCEDCVEKSDWQERRRKYLARTEKFKPKSSKSHKSSFRSFGEYSSINSMSQEDIGALVGFLAVAVAIMIVAVRQRTGK
jgi:hypothetical protein